jgi:hypothetical protein
MVFRSKPAVSPRSVVLAPGISRLLLGASLAASLAWSAPAVAQSAADKATARELAVQGIKKLEAGDAEGALKSLEKAQALYDAPIHLLYLGRAHTRLGHLVEAAEAYRTLARTEIGEDDPAAFKKAQIDGQEELDVLEPRLAKLTIEVEPEADGLEVTVDEKPINTAGLSVPRATNPGRRMIRAVAPGYLPAESEVTLGEGGAETVQLRLEADPNAPVAEADAASAASSSGNGAEEAAEKEDERSGPMGFILGIRGGGVLPVGELTSGVASTDYFQPGGGGRVELGFRFLHYVGIKGYFSMGGLSPGGELDRFAKEQESGILAKNSGSFMDAGVLLMGTTDPRILGGFGEVGVALLHKYEWQQKFSGAGVDCTMGADYSGWAIRAGGGMNIPANRFLDFVPAVDVSVGQFGTLNTNSDCPVPTADELGVAGADTRFSGDTQTALHYQIFLGFGADLHFGDGLFR